MYSFYGFHSDGSILQKHDAFEVFREVFVDPHAAIHTNFDTMDGGRCFSEKQRLKDRNQAQRFAALRNGRVVLHTSQREEMDALATYYKKCGLATRDIRSRAVFVDAPLHDTEAVFEEIGSTKGEHTVIEPYFASPSLVSMARQKRVRLKHAQPSSLSFVERLNDKGHFAQMLDRWFLEAHGERFFPYPFVTYERERTGSLVTGIEACIRYARRYRRALKYLLIVQETSLSGGLGNHFVDHEMMLHLADGTRIPLRNTRGLIEWLEREDRSVRIAPFLDVIESYSCSLTLSRGCVAWDGPRYQLVDEHGAWIGCQLRREVRDLEREGIVCRLVGHELTRIGFSGTVAIDFFRFRSPDGEELVSAFELNGRMNGNAGALGMFLRYPRWRTRALTGTLSLEYHASCSLPAKCATIEGVVRWLEDRGVGVSSSNDPDGVTLVTHPVGDGEGGTIAGVLIVASTDASRDELVQRIFE
jgi:hypothetical protein